MRVTTRTMLSRLLIVAVVAAVALPGAALGDKDLIEMRGAPPNVLIIMDSGATMVHDPETNDQKFFTSGDHPGSKLYQAKRVLSGFIPQVMGQFNLGMTYSELPERAINFHSYIYSIRTVCSDLTLSSCGEAVTLDGQSVGERLRLGSDDDFNHNPYEPPIYPIYFGTLGADKVCRYSIDGVTWQVVDCDAAVTIVPGAVKVVSELWNPSTNMAKGASAPFYYPAYDWSALPQWVRNGLSGALTWTGIATSQGLTVDPLNPTWKQTIHDQAQAALEAARIGGADPLANGQLLVAKQVEWTAGTGADGNPKWQEGRTRYVSFGFEERFVVADRPNTSADDSQIESSETFTAVYGKGGGGDTGYRSNPFGTSHEPLVPIPLPDPTTGAITYNPATYRNELLSILQPQSSGFFFFPLGGAPACKYQSYTQPCQENYQIPLTGGAVAGGRTNLEKAWSSAANYFADVKGADDPFGVNDADCRNSYIIVISDGLDHESSSFCSTMGAQLKNVLGAAVPVYMIGFGPESAFNTASGSTLTCTVEETGGDWFIAENAAELADTLLRIQVLIEERTRAFAALAVSSVQTNYKQNMFISTFFPWNSRSVWQGHLNAYLVDPLTGLPPLDANNRPDETAAEWDAGIQLAKMSDANRAMYFGDPVTPGTRHEFKHDVDTSRAKLQRWISDRITMDVTLGDKKDDFEVDETIQVCDASRTARVVSWSHDRNAFDGSMVVEILTGTWIKAEIEGGCSVTGLISGVVAPSVSTFDSRFESTVDFIRGVRKAGLYDTSMEGGIEKLGDVFHSIPQLVGSPSCGPCQRQPGYYDFFVTHARRRFVLYVGANDGAMHAFDAGLWDTDEGTFDTGTGDELFGWVPQAVMGSLGNLATSTGHRFTADGTPTVADVYIDDDGDPATEPVWRTVAYFGLRRGGASILALDVTQPDLYTDGVAVPTIQDALRLPSCREGAAGCSGMWPAFKWEFQDLEQALDSDGNPATDAAGDPIMVRANSDNVGTEDLGETWSRPLVGFIRVLPAGETDPTRTQLRSVVIFGGGRSTDGLDGNWIYFLDAGSGEVLLKQQTVGMVTGQVAATDDNVDGVLERLFWATTAGRVYRMTLPLPLTLDESDGSISGWEAPELVLNAGPTYPFYITPTVVPITANPDGTYRYAVVIGSGNRDDIMERSPIQRFFAFTDQGPNTLPLGGADASLLATHLADVTTPVDPATNYLQNHPTKNGWFFDLSAQWEKVNTRAVVYRGDVIFSTFTPSDVIETVPLDDGTNTCKMRGDAKTYLVQLLQGNPSEVDGEMGGDDRYVQHDTVVDMVSDTLLYATAGGAIMGNAVGDDTAFVETSDWGAAPVNVTIWKER